MEGIIIITLFCLQLISFFLIVILFAKLNKFKELERKQQQTVEEMDAALGAYLMEMKEENERFIQKLSTIPKPEKESKVNSNVPSHMHNQPKEQINSVKKFVSPSTASTVYKTNIEKQTQFEEATFLTSKPTVTEKIQQEIMPANAHIETVNDRVIAQVEELPQAKELNDEEKIVAMYKAGSSIEEIAKNLNKGKTEVELLIKFHT